MLDDLLAWIAAGDSAIRTMGPVAAIAVAWAGGFGITQAVKFPLVAILPATWERWGIRTVAVIATGALLIGLADLRPALSIAIAVLQPYGYSVVMAVVRHRWPWLEATRTTGSVRPSGEAVDALVARIEQRRIPETQP